MKLDVFVDPRGQLPPAALPRARYVVIEPLPAEGIHCTRVDSVDHFRWTFGDHPGIGDVSRLLFEDGSRPVHVIHDRELLVAGPELVEGVRFSAGPSWRGATAAAAVGREFVCTCDRIERLGVVIGFVPPDEGCEMHGHRGNGSGVP